MDEDQVEPDVPTVGERLRAAREAKDLSLEDLAAQTRIPLRHLTAIETADWDSLPAPTYTIGFAKSYASAVGLDRAEIGDQLRAEMGGQRFAANTAEIYETADPARTMPKWLVLGGIAAVIVLVVLMSWLNRRSLEAPEEPVANAPAAVAAAPAAQAPRPAAPAAAPSAQGPVVLTATDAVWFEVRDKGATLFSGTLQPGQTYAVPATAIAPVLKTGKPEALKINVGSAVAPPVGPPATTVSVSLLGPDLLKGPQKPAVPALAAPKPRPKKPAATAPAVTPAPAETPPTTNTGG